MKTLYLDIETAPNLAHVWALFRQNIGLPQLLESSRMLCFSAKWAEAKRVSFYSEADRDTMLCAAYDLLNAADVVVTYNGKSFDVPVINKELWLAGFDSPSSFHELDIYRVIKRRFRLPSYKLDYVAQILGVGAKLKHEGHELWVKAMAGDQAAVRRMARYCKHDTWLLQQVHERSLSWIGSYAPNVALIDGIEIAACPHCGKSDLAKDGFRYTKIARYQRFLCRQCGSRSTSRRAIAAAELSPI